MSRQDYEAIDALNWSTLRLVATSPLLARYRADNPRPDSPSLALGRAIHCAVLEPERWQRDYCAQPHFGDGRTKAAKAAKAAFLADLRPGVEVLSAGDFELAERVRDSVREHRVAATFLERGRAEVTATWSVDGVAAKGRLDWVTPSCVVDLKSTRRETLREFCSDAARMLYHGQIAWYHDGAVASGLVPDPAKAPIIIAAQTVEPFDVAVMQVGSIELEAGRRIYRRLLETHKRAAAADFWPGMAPDLVSLSLPGWAPGMQDEIEDEEW
jgi:hypothetical protein